MMQKELSKIFL